MSFNAHARAGLLERMAATPLDVLVVGGGITGCGVALDAAARGLRVGLVERDDIASGTSSKSSKLVHGGLRYLATGDVSMVVEGVREREHLRRLAPHLVRPLGFVVPTDTRVDAAMLRVGLLAYDAMAVGHDARRHRRLSTADVLANAPGLARGFRRGGFLYDDAQTDDARLTLAVLRAAIDHGAMAVTRAEVAGVEPGASGVRVAIRDRHADQDVQVQARWVVGAGGAWADGLRVDGHAAAPRLVPAKGVHLVFDAVDLPVQRAVVLPSARSDGRRVFLIPWGRQVYLGTTDDPDDDDVPRMSLEDADYLLDAVNAAFGADLSVSDAIGAWAGWRPLVAGEGATADLSRRHMVHQAAPGVVIVTGGKLTTYRRMAADTVDVVAAGLGAPGRTSTTRIPLGATATAADGLAATRARLLDLGGDPTWAGSLWHRHGDAAPTVVATASAADELEPLVDGLPYLVGEVRWAARHEMVLSLEDALSRRLRVALRHAGAGGGAIDRAAAILAEELGWSAATRDEQVAAYRAAVQAERGPVPLR
jgi:glycerol-3-phosphate dehydrogenase